MSQVTSASDIKAKLHKACCKCRELKQAAEQRESMRDAFDAGSNQAPRTVGPSASFSAIPNKG